MLEPRVVQWETRGKTKTKIRKNSLTTVGIYLRNVRTIFNESKITGPSYPFGKGLFQIPKGRGKKRALTQNQVAMIAAYKCAGGTIEQRSRDYWLFSYLCNGINFKDIARLRYSNLIKDYDGDVSLNLIRAKTAETVSEPEVIEIPVTKQIGRIIDRWGNKPGNPDQYIFPVFSPGMAPVEEYKTLQQLIQTTNKHLKYICSDLNLPPVTTYAARHSFATVLKRSGASVEFISESLGHQNTGTTKSYLKSFEKTEKQKWAKTLLPDSEN